MEVGASCSSSHQYPLEIDQLFEAFGSAFSMECIASTYVKVNHDVDMAGEILCHLQAGAVEDVDKSPRVSAESCNLSGSGDLHRFVPEVDSKTPVTMETDRKEIDEFVFKMLGDGFQLGMPVIQEVLSACGYDMEKSMETLLDLTAPTLEKRDNILNKAPEVSSQCSEEMVVDLSSQDKSQHSNSIRSSKKKNKVKNEIEKELLQSLFTVSIRLEDEPKKCLPRPQISKSGRFGRVVHKPVEDPSFEHKTLYMTPLQNPKEDEDSFHKLRQAVNEHRATMKEYYKAACEAFVKGDHERASRLMEQGHFFSKKARELDDLALQKIVGPIEQEDELLMDLSIYEPKDSVQFLRSQLVYLCVISSVPYIKIKLGNGDGGATERARKKRIFKLLDKDSIKWTEAENEHIISIRVDEIDPNSLSFSKKSSSVKLL